MTRSASSMSDAESVKEALKLLDQKGIAGLNAALDENQELIEHLCIKVSAILDARKTANKPGDNSGSSPAVSSPNGPDQSPAPHPKRGGEHRPAPAAGEKHKTVTQKRRDEFGSKPATYMARFVIMQHLANHSRDRSVKTILHELVSAGLMDKEQRPSLVTSLNRLKKDKLITWPDTARGEQIVLTPEGSAYLGELISRRLQDVEIAYLRQYTSRVHKCALAEIKRQPGTAHPMAGT